MYYHQYFSLLILLGLFSWVQAQDMSLPQGRLYWSKGIGMPIHYQVDEPIYAFYWGETDAEVLSLKLGEEAMPFRFRLQKIPLQQYIPGLQPLALRWHYLAFSPLPYPLQSPEHLRLALLIDKYRTMKVAAWELCYWGQEDSLIKGCINIELARPNFPHQRAVQIGQLRRDIQQLRVEIDSNTLWLKEMEAQRMELWYEMRRKREEADSLMENYSLLPAPKADVLGQLCKLLQQINFLEEQLASGQMQEAKGLELLSLELAQKTDYYQKQKEYQEVETDLQYYAQTLKSSLDAYKKGLMLQKILSTHKRNLLDEEEKLKELEAEYQRLLRTDRQ